MNTSDKFNINNEYIKKNNIYKYLILKIIYIIKIFNIINNDFLKINIINNKYIINIYNKNLYI